jgi:hypothetical protein
MDNIVDSAPRREMMKTKTLATAMVLLCSFVLAPSLLRADPNEWYQGRQGQWVQEQNAWRFRDTTGDEYREYGNTWRWANPVPVAHDDDWYQGRQGQWVESQNAWRFRDRDGNIYRQHGNSWRWYNGRRHGAEGSEYHNRAPGDNRTYQQFQQQEGH